MLRQGGLKEALRPTIVYIGYAAEVGVPTVCMQAMYTLEIYAIEACAYLPLGRALIMHLNLSGAQASIGSSEVGQA